MLYPNDNLLQTEKDKLHGSKSWPEFFDNLPAFLRLKRSLVKRDIGLCMKLCKVYDGPDRWDVWIEYDHAFPTILRHEAEQKMRAT